MAVTVARLRVPVTDPPPSLLVAAPLPERRRAAAETTRKYGILLLEILTGRVPCSEVDGPLEQCASPYFGCEMSLVELIDPSIGSFPEDAARALCEVVRSCIDPDPKKRPQMAEVAAQMREIAALGPDGATPKVSPLWWVELEIMSSESKVGCMRDDIMSPSVT